MLEGYSEERKASIKRLFTHLLNDPEIAERLSHITEQHQVTITYMGYLVSALRETLYLATHHTHSALEQAALVVEVSKVLSDTASWDIRAVERASLGQTHPEFPALDIDPAELNMLMRQYEEENM